MQKKYFNWGIGGLTLLLTLAVLFGGQLLWNKYAVANPINKVFQSVAGVELISVGRLQEQGKNNEKIKIYVKLSDVPNFQSLYNEIIEGLEEVDGSKKYDIVIRDSRTPELEQFYYANHYYIQEAIFTGNFVAMAEHIQSNANRAGIDSQIYVDKTNVYLKIAKGDAEMYVVITRDTGVQEVK